MRPFIIPVVYLVAITALLSLPGNQFPKAPMFHIAGFDKIVHTVMFAILMWLFGRAIRKAQHLQAPKKWLWVTAAGAVVYGAAMEFVQKYWVPFRSFELADIAVDTLGVAIGFWLVRHYTPAEQAAGNSR